jgi:hypothetical protein
MASLFSKTDPAVKRQRDLEAKLAAQRANRDNLTERRKAAMASATTHREKARKLAGDGADDTALSTVEAAMRREQDRAATLGDAIGDAEVTIADLEREIAEIVDQRCRAETVAAVTALVDKWASAGAAFDAAVTQLADLARESAVITLDAHPLHQFLEAVKQQVPPAAEMVANVLQHHAKAVLAGTAPASLPKPEAQPAPAVAVEQKPPTRTLFAMRSIKWREDGRQRTALQWSDVELPEHLAERALRTGACVPLTSEHRKKLLGARGGQHPPSPDTPDLTDLDLLSDASGAIYEPLAAQNDAVITANFKRMDRGGPITGTIAAARAP